MWGIPPLFPIPPRLAICRGGEPTPQSQLRGPSSYKGVGSGPRGEGRGGMEKEGGAVIGGGGQWPKMEKRLVQMGNPPPSRPREDLGGVCQGTAPPAGRGTPPPGPREVSGRAGAGFLARKEKVTQSVAAPKTQRHPPSLAPRQGWERGGGWGGGWAWGGMGVPGAGELGCPGQEAEDSGGGGCPGQVPAGARGGGGLQCILGGGIAVPPLTAGLPHP